MMKTRQHKRIRIASHSPRQGTGSDHGEVREIVANVSPRDISNCSFTKETSKDKDVARTISPKSLETKVERNEDSSMTKEKKNVSASDVVMNVKQNMKEKRDEKVRDAVRLKKNEEDRKQKANANPKDSEGTDKVDRPNDKVTEKEQISAAIRNGAANARQGAAEAEQRTEETATSSSSSFSKRTSRARRTSTAYLQQTRAHRRAVAKARTERLKREREEEYEQEQLRKLDDMAEGERERAIESLESERREREAVKRREVKRVKNRESVEKSRVRELVFEAQVGCEWDALREENERMIQVMEWFKRDNVIKEARKEVNGVVRKRKRRKMM